MEMEDDHSDIRQTNFRIKQETADQFRRYCESVGMTQAQGFDHIMQIVELNRAKETVPNRQTEIESFEMATKSINDLYLQSLETCANAESRAREQYARQLDSKDKVIADLQVRLEKAEESEKIAHEAQEAAEQAEKAARASADTAERERASAEQMAAAKDQVNNTLSEKLARQEKSLEEHDRLLEELSECKNKITNLETQLHDANMQMDLAKERATIELERAIMATKEEMQDKLREADKENATLQAKVELLQQEKG